MRQPSKQQDCLEKLGRPLPAEGFELGGTAAADHDTVSARVARMVRFRYDPMRVEHFELASEGRAIHMPSLQDTVQNAKAAALKPRHVRLIDPEAARCIIP